MNTSEARNQQVTIRKDVNGGFSFHAREMGNMDTIEKVNAVVESPSNATQTGKCFEAGRAGLLDVTIFLNKLTKREAKDLKIILIRRARAAGFVVLNTKK